MEREVRADQARHGGVAWHDFTFFIGKLFADSNANLSINSERLFMIANHSHVIRPQNAFPECRAPATPSQPASLPVKYPARNPRANFRVETTTPLGSSLSLSLCFAGNLLVCCIICIIQFSMEQHGNGKLIANYLSLDFLP